MYPLIINFPSFFSPHVSKLVPWKWGITETASGRFSFPLSSVISHLALQLKYFTFSQLIYWQADFQSLSANQSSLCFDVLDIWRFVDELGRETDGCTSVVSLEQWSIRASWQMWWIEIDYLSYMFENPFTFAKCRCVPI